MNTTTERQVYSVREFCDAHNISRALLYKSWELGTGPRYLKAGNRTLITLEAAAAWRAELEQESVA